jgi:hypothetical protein
MNQEEAANMPLWVRVAGFAHEQGLTPQEALERLAELGLRHELEERMLTQGAGYLPPIFLYASYLGLAQDATS